MKLQRFRIQNFRCIYDSEWVDVTNPTVLIGCNDGGKTATLEALDYLFKNQMPPVNAYSYSPGSAADAEGNRPRQSSIVIETILTLGEEEKLLLQEQLLVPPGESIQIRKTFDRESSTVNTEVMSSSPLDSSLPSSVADLKIGDIRTYLASLNIDNPGGQEREPLKEALRQWLCNQPLEEKWVPVPSVLIDALPNYQIVEGGDPERTILQVLSVLYRNLLKEPAVQALLSSYQTGIDQQLKQPLEERTATLAEYVCRYLPDITEATVRPEFEVDAKLKTAPLTLVGRDGAPIDLSARGAGTRQQVNLAVFEWNADTMQVEGGPGSAHTILAFDEPDLHLDYEAQKRIYGAIESYLNKGVQILISTHSINFINRVPIECIHHYSKLAGELQSTIKCLSPDADDSDEMAFFVDQIGESMGFDNATILYERCFLAFEGQTERLALPILFKSYKQDTLLRAGIKLVNCYDAHGAIVFAKFLHKHGRPVIFMVDEDTTFNKGTRRILTTDALERAGFSIAEQVHIVRPGCFEYAFSDVIWAQVLNENEPDGGQDWSAEKIAPFRTNPRAFIDKIQEILQESSKPNIGRMLARAAINVEDIPSEIRQCFDNALAKANS